MKKQASYVTLPAYIENALYHPDTGYYGSARVQFGPDFETYALDWAPLLAERFFRAWQTMLAHQEIGEADTFYIYEFGAGTGAMALTILKFIHGRSELDPQSAWARFYQSLKYVIGEYSGGLILQQKNTLECYAALGKIEFHQTDARMINDNLPRGAGVVVSNELIDSFPPHEITLQGESILATVIETVDGKNLRKLLPADQVLTAQEFAFLQETLANAQGLIKPSTLFYLHPAMENYYKKLEKLVTKGFVLTLDYGRDACYYFDDLENVAQLRTFSHQHGKGKSILEYPGELDITCEINFSDLAHVGEKYGFKFTYYGVQDALGGAYAPEFRVLIQSRGLNPACDIELCRDMRQSSPLLYKDMPALAQQVTKLKSLIANLQQHFANDDFNNIEGAFANYLDWLILQNYLKKDRAFMVLFDEMFSLQLLMFFREMICTDSEKRRSLLLAQLTTLLQNADYVEILLHVIAHYTQKIVDQRNDSEYAEHQAGMQIFFRMLELFRSFYPMLTEKVLNLEALRDYNFITSLKPEQLQHTLLSRCLVAADNACVAAMHKMGLFSDSSLQEETTSSHCRPSHM